MVTRLWAVLLATAAVRIGFGAITPVLPLYVREHGLDTFMIALMTNAFLLAQVLFQTPAGHLGDRWGRRPVLLLGAGLYTVAAALFLFDGGPWYFVALRAVEGLGASAFGPTVRAFLADLVPEEQRGRVFGQLMSFEMAGILLGPLLGGFAQSWWGPQAPFAVCALLGLVAVATLWLLARAPRPAATGAVAVGPPRAGDVVVAARETDAQGTGVTSRALLQTAAFWVVVLPNLGFAYFTGLYNVVWSLYMQQHGASTWQVGLSYTAFAIPMVALTVPFGRLADRVGRPLLIGIGGAISTVTTLCYAVFPAPLALIGLSGVDGFASALFMPASSAYMADVAPRAIRGKFFGLVGTVSTAATIGCVLLVGWMYEHTPVPWLFYLGGGALVLSCGSAVLLMLRHPVERLRAALERA